MNKFDFSLILPCYNEAEIFNDSVKRIIEVLDGTNYTWEIIFIDDCSTDGTRKLIKSPDWDAYSTDLNRAIVECVTKMQLEKQK
mgnify:CR=1 FL=1